MVKANGNCHQTTKWLRWIARIWSFPIIAYALMLFIGYAWSWVTTGVADPYAVEEVPLVETLQPILLFISIIGLGIAWRWEKTGTVISLIFLITTLVLLVTQRPITLDFSLAMLPYMLTIVVAIPGVLFLVCSISDQKG
jgi:uncharacterized membrane protein